MKAKTAKTTSIWNQETELLCRSDLEDLQLTRLKKLLDYLEQNNSFYRQRLKEAGIASSDIHSLNDVRDLPFTNKVDLQNNQPYGLYSKPVAEISRLHCSSGSKGNPIIVGYSKNDLAVWSEVCARSLVCAGANLEDIIQNSYGYGLFTGGLGIHYGAELLGATIIPASGGMTRRQIGLLQDLKANILCCTPTYALNIACAMEELGIPSSSINLRLGIFGAEPWTEEMRKQLEERLSIEALDIYGLAEIMGPGVAIECSHSRKNKSGLHVWQDHFLVEIIDPETGLPLPDGEEGELVFTTLTKEAMPLLRYRTGDISRLNKQICQCGRSMAKIARIKARIDDMLIIRGVNFYPTAVEEILLSRHELSPRYLLIIEREKALDTLNLQVELKWQIAQSWENSSAQSQTQDHKNKLKDDIKNLLKDLLSLTAEVELMPPGALLTSEGKSIKVIDRRAVKIPNKD